MPISRRLFVIGLGGSLAATSMLWGLGGLDWWSPESRMDTPLPTNTYVDHEGWFLTVEDKARLLGAANVRTLENTNLPGADIGNKIVSDVSACASWCLLEASCRSFTYTKADHPEPRRRGVCWIKGSTPDAVTSEFHISGILE
jgi:hypothetical protein